MDILENAKPEDCFYCIDGSVLRNMLELEQKLRTISNRAFYHHASQSRNDFRNWVKDVFHEHNLADELLKARTPAEASAAVRRHIRKTFLAEEEIESAIRKVVEARKPTEAKVKAKAKGKTIAAAAKKMPKLANLPKLPKRKAQAKKAAKVTIAAAATKTKKQRPKNKIKRKNKKNKKLNKKQRKKTVSRSNHGKPKSPKRDWAQSPGRRLGRGKTVHSRNRNGGAGLQKTVKKQMRQWLKWLNINPEL
ncbi:hypothetical protein HYV85_03805 [Candidatus Woesearchaeota archaeon]|nr:hypothetical protein [Candidatus Woesearchaeota archaeon]